MDETQYPCLIGHFAADYARIRGPINACVWALRCIDQAAADRFSRISISRRERDRGEFCALLTQLNEPICTNYIYLERLLGLYPLFLNIDRWWVEWIVGKDMLPAVKCYLDSEKFLSSDILVIVIFKYKCAMKSIFVYICIYIYIYISLRVRDVMSRLNFISSLYIVRPMARFRYISWNAVIFT